MLDTIGSPRIFDLAAIECAAFTDGSLIFSKPKMIRIPRPSKLIQLVSGEKIKFFLPDGMNTSGCCPSNSHRLVVAHLGAPMTKKLSFIISVHLTSGPNNGDSETRPRLPIDRSALPVQSFVIWQLLQRFDPHQVDDPLLAFDSQVGPYLWPKSMADDQHIGVIGQSL